MDLLTFLNALVSTATPALPAPELTRAVMPWSWGFVLAALWSLFAMRWANTKLRWSVAALIVLVCLLPEPWSVAYWLALAFQMPSLALQFICVAVIVSPQRVMNSALDRPWFNLVPGIALGWILLLDTLAVWPLSIYSFGFSTLATGVVALAVGVLWVLSTNSRPLTISAVAIAIAVFVGNRLPTGNVWDAVLDPWLWGALHLLWVMAWLRRRAVKP